MNFPRATILPLCQQYGPQLHVPEGIDGAKLMYAISMNESGCGANCTPRHEPAYDVGGLYGRRDPQLALLQHYSDKAPYSYGAWQASSPAAYSYGPWQIMLVSAWPFTPDELLSDADKNAQAFVHFMNSWVFKYRKAATLQQIAETYNSGTFGPNMSAGVLKYAAEAQQHYESAPF